MRMEELKALCKELPLWVLLVFGGALGVQNFNARIRELAHKRLYAIGLLTKCPGESNSPPVQRR